MTPIDWAVLPLKKYAVFTGRAPRAEYWWFRLSVGVLSILIGFLNRLLLHGPMYGSYSLLGLTLMATCAIPGLAVAIRRLHDTERSGWWAIATSVPNFILVAAGGSIGTVGLAIKNESGPLFALELIGFLALTVAVIFVVICMILPGNKGPNRYGPDPYGPDSLEEVFA